MSKPLHEQFDTAFHKTALQCIRQSPIKYLRVWMHGGEYECGPHDMVDYGPKPMTATEWVDHFSHANLVAYIGDKVGERDLGELDEFMGQELAAWGWVRPTLKELGYSSPTADKAKPPKKVYRTRAPADFSGWVYFEVKARSMEEAVEKTKRGKASILRDEITDIGDIAYHDAEEKPTGD